MKRKEFIGKTVSAGILPVVLNGFSLQAFADSPLVSLLNKAGNEDRVLVLIQLNGGNDGLNTIIPLDQYNLYVAARANIAIPENKVLSIDGTQATGFHPAMTHLRNLFNEGKVGVIQNVGYPNQDFSHFRSTDIWLTGSDADKYEETGWMGRYLDTKYPNYPTGYPNATYPDPPAIQIGAMISPALQGANMSMGMSITDPTNFYQFVSGTVDPAPNTPYGHELTFLRLVAQQTQQYSGSIKGAADKATNKSTLYPTAGQNTLADQLKIVARLVAGGLKTKVYMVSLGGFDTHAIQVATGSPETGTHATLLGRVSEAINAFQDDLKLLGVEDKVLGMTFSEFGRRIKSNDSLGTDHGAAAPLFLFGSKVSGGITGANAQIPVNPSPADNVAMQYDFRSVYASVLKYWFGVSDEDLTQVMMNQFPLLPVVEGSTGSEELLSVRDNQISCYPNPARDNTRINYTSLGGEVRISIGDMNGKILLQPFTQTQARGSQTLNLDLTGFAEGIYFVSVEQGNQVQTLRLLIQRR